MLRSAMSCRWAAKALRAAASLQQRGLGSQSSSADTSAQVLLDSALMAPEDPESLKTVLRALLSAGKENSLAAVQRWQRSGFPLRLDACKDAMISMTSTCHSELLAGMRDWGLTPDLECYEVALRTCGRKGEPQKAMRLLRDMKASGFPPTNGHYRYVMHAWSNGKPSEVAAAGDAAVALLQEMRSEGVEPDSDSYFKAIKSCHDGRALDILAQQTAAGLAVEPRTYKEAIGACAKVGLWRDALRLFDDQAAAEPGAVASRMYEHALHACANLMLGKRAAQLLRVLRQREHSSSNSSSGGERVSSRAYLFAIMACRGDQSTGGDWQQALQILHSIPCARVTKHQCHAALDALARGGRYKEASDLISVFMARTLVAPGVWEYTAVINAYVTGGKWQRALQLYDRMLDALPGASLLRSTHHARMKAYWEGHKRLEVLTAFEDMVEAGIAPTLMEFTLAMQACAAMVQHGDTKRYKAAANLLQEMQMLKVKPDAFLMELAADCFAAAGQAAMALQVVQEMKQMSMAVPAGLNTAVLRACAKSDQWRSVLRAMEDVIAAEPTPTQESYHLAILACCSAGRVQRAIEVLNDMLARTKGKVPPCVEQTYGVIITTAVQRKHYTLVPTLFESMAQAGVEPQAMRRSYDSALDTLLPHVVSLDGRGSRELRQPALPRRRGSTCTSAQAQAGPVAAVPLAGSAAQQLSDRLYADMLSHGLVQHWQRDTADQPQSPPAMDLRTMGPGAACAALRCVLRGVSGDSQPQRSSDVHTHDMEHDLVILPPEQRRQQFRQRQEEQCTALAALVAQLELWGLDVEVKHPTVSSAQHQGSVSAPSLRIKSTTLIDWYYKRAAGSRDREYLL